MSNNERPSAKSTLNYRWRAQPASDGTVAIRTTNDGAPYAYFSVTEARKLADAILNAATEVETEASKSPAYRAVESLLKTDLYPYWQSRDAIRAALRVITEAEAK